LPQVSVAAGPAEKPAAIVLVLVTTTGGACAATGIAASVARASEAAYAAKLRRRM
jgi:hypothetical protein